METSQHNPHVVDIVSVAFGGKGIARCDGKVWFVADAIEGDRVIMKPIAENKRYGDAVIEKIVTPSPFRSPPLCPVAHPCGGCQWMGVDYTKQCEWKKNFLSSAIQRIGKINGEQAITFLPSPNLYEYRNRILVRVEVQDDGSVRTGYFAKGSKTLVPTGHCLIAAAPVNQTLASIHQLKFPANMANTFKIEIQELPFNDPQVAITVYPDREAPVPHQTLVETLRQLPDIFWIGLVWETREAPEFLYDEQFQIKFYSRPGQFQQVNRPHNQTLRQLVRDLVMEVNPSRILDIFCGSGNLSLGLSDGHRYVEGIEFNPEAIAMAKENVSRNGLKGTCYLSGDTEKHLWKIYRKGEKFDLVIADPPRQGMYESLIPLKNMAPNDIIYVSCDPTTLARDLASLCRNDLYHIEKIYAFDFFPNTYHIETLVKLKKS